MGQEMTVNTIYESAYHSSHALIIGINKYRTAPPLEYARNDAEEIASYLENKFDFPKANISLLLDEDATRENILSHFLKYANEGSEPNDRIVVFFAGHGCTVT